MGKNNGLSIFKERDRFYKGLDAYFDQGWKEFVNEINRKNLAHNVRLLKALSEVRGVGFSSDLMKLMKSVGAQYSLLKIEKKPSGVLLKNAKFHAIPEFWANQRSVAEGMVGRLFIQVKPERWVSFGY